MHRGQAHHQHTLTEQCGKLHTPTFSTLLPFIKTFNLLIMKMAHHLMKLPGRVAGKADAQTRVRQQVEREVAGLCH